MKEESTLSVSEKHGLDLMKETDLKILSVGISTAGVAEIEMAKRNKNRHIIATTIDEEGIQHTKEKIEKEDLSSQIETKIEDVSKKMPYPDNYFDFVYARLVLHYLDNQNLRKALSEIHRVIKENGTCYIVVRSVNEWEAKLEGTTFDEETGLTKYPYVETMGTDHVVYAYKRLHSQESIQQFLEEAGLTVEYVKEYEEYLYWDYERTQINSKPNTIIEVCAKKKQ